MRRGRKPRISAFWFGVIVLAAAVVVTYFGFTKEVPFQDHFELKAAFRSANNIRADAPVRVAGVNVGKVTKIEKVASHGGVARDGAIVTMRIEKEDTVIHNDAKVTIRPRIFLEGNFFVDMQPGSPAAPRLGDEDTIPVQNTATPVQLDQVLTALQTDTREDLKVLLKEYSSGLKGEGGRGFNRSIKWWEPAYKNSAVVNQATLGLIDGDLSGYIRNAGAFAEAADANSEQLKSLITDFNTTANAFARENVSLESAVAQVPRTLRAAEPALSALNDAFPPVRRLVSDLRPAVESSGPAIDAAMPFLRQARALVSQPEARGLVRDLRPTVPSLAALQNGTVPLLEQVRAASSCQNEVILPWTLDKIDDPNFPAKGKVYEEAPKFLPGIAGESRSGDANGQWFRVLATGGNYTVAYGNGVFAQTYSPLQGTNPPKPTSRPPIRPDVPCETQQQPDLRTQVGQAPRTFRNEVDTKSEREGYEAYEKGAVGWLKDQVKLEGLDNVLKVVTGDKKQDTADEATAPVKAEAPDAPQQVLEGLEGDGRGGCGMTAIRKNAKSFAALIGLIVVAAIVGGYILANQRLRFPLIEDAPLRLKAEFSTAQAVTPGQGQTVRVSGVKVGDIGEVELKGGRAVVTMEIDRKYDTLVRRDATALLRPKTGLKDMFIELNPGSNQTAAMEEDDVVPIQNTLPDVNPDEVLGALDGDTRDYLKLLVSGGGEGLDKRGGDLREVFRRFEPTHRDLALVTEQVATRRQNLRRLIHSLNLLNGELADRGPEVAQLIDSSARVFRAFASEQNDVSQTVRELPSALRQTTTALGKVERFARQLGPTADNLRPVFRSLDDANRELRPFARQVTPVLRDDVRPFVREARPLVRDLRPTAQQLAQATPDLEGSFKVLNHLFNTLGFNPDGREDPSKRTRQEGYLFWIAWIGHQATNLFSTADAHGTFRPITLGGTCGSLAAVAGEEQELGHLLNLAPIVDNPAICPKQAEQGPHRRKLLDAKLDEVAKFKARSEAKGKGADR